MGKMKKILIVMFMAMIIVSAVSAKGFIGGTAGYEIGALTIDDVDYDIENAYGALRGGHFFGKSAHHGIVYYLGVGSCLKSETGGVDSSDNIDATATAFAGYGFRLGLGKSMDAVIGVGPVAVSYAEDDETATFGGLGVSLMGDFHLAKKIALIYGADIKFIATAEYSDDSAPDPDETSGCFITPFIGCSFCY